MIKLTTTFFCFLLCIFLRAQSTYEVIFLGDYDDSVSLNPSLNWYVYHTNALAGQQRFIPVSIQTDLVQTFNSRDSLYTLSLDSTFVSKGWILIGSTDTIQTLSRYYEQDI